MYMRLCESIKIIFLIYHLVNIEKFCLISRCIYSSFELDYVKFKGLQIKCYRVKKVCRNFERKYLFGCLKRPCNIIFLCLKSNLTCTKTIMAQGTRKSFTFLRILSPSFKERPWTSSLKYLVDDWIDPWPASGLDI